jgi:ABC-2 type transport system permease protein
MSDLLLFRGALRDLIRPKRLLAAAPLVVLPAALALLWRGLARAGSFQPEVVYNTLTGGLIFGFTLVILAVLFGTGVVSQEIEQRTIVYLLTRPVPRARILLAKFLGAFAGITATVWLSTLLLALIVFGPSQLGRPLLRRDLLILAVGALAYGSLFLLSATCLNRPLIYGLFFAFGWESWIPLLPGAFQKVSIMTYLRVLAPHGTLEDTQGSLADFLSRLSPTTVAPATARWALLVVILAALGAALAVFSEREYAPREDDE